MGIRLIFNLELLYKTLRKDHASLVVYHPSLGSVMARLKGRARRRRTTRRKKGGFLPLLPLLGAIGALAGGASAVANSINNARNAKKTLAELIRHNTAMETRGKGLRSRRKRRHSRRKKNICFDSRDTERIVDSRANGEVC